MAVRIAESLRTEIAVMASAARIRFSPYAGLAAALLSSACTPTAVPSVGSSAMPYVAINTRTQTYFPEARTRGAFALSDGCVVFRRAEDNLLFTPVFPAGSRLVSAGSSYTLEIKGKQHALGREVILGGGQVTLPEYTEVKLASAPPASCPATVWIVSNVLER